VRDPLRRLADPRAPRRTRPVGMRIAQIERARICSEDRPQFETLEHEINPVKH
jgi:hypothetical protein